MKKHSSRSLVFKIGIVNLTAIIIIIATITVSVGIMMTITMERITEEKIDLLAEQNAKVAGEYLNTLEQTAATLGKAVMSYGYLSSDESKLLTKNLFTKSLSDRHIFGVYLAVEPNTYFDDTPDGYSFYAYRNEEGNIIYENYGYDDYKDGEFYADTKASMNSEVTEPYSWTLTNGEEIWLISISTPLTDERGNFVGVVNCDVAVDTILDLAYNKGGYQTAYSYILTDNGNYVVHSEDKSKFGIQYESLGSTDRAFDAALNGDRASFDGINQIYGGKSKTVHVPLYINEIEKPWSSAFVVSGTEVMRPIWNIVFTILVIAVAGAILLIVISTVYLKKSLNPASGLVTMAQDIQNGVLSSEVDVKSEDELGQLSHIFNKTAIVLNGYIAEISNILGAISEGDLTQDIHREYAGDFADIKSSLMLIRESLNSTFSEIGAVASQVSDNADQVADGAQTLASTATEQAAAMEELSSTIAKVYEDVKKNSQNVVSATQYIDTADDELKKSNHYMEQLLLAVDEISKSSDKISSIIKMIDDISFQTNILALNAAVEAARAGTAGKGFAVVADEVRSLAARSAEAARQTTGLIHTSVEAANNGLNLANQTADSLNSVSRQVLLVKQSNTEINDASQEQLQAIMEINSGMEQLSGAVQTIAAASEENSASGKEMSAHAQRLFELINKFKIKETKASATEEL